MTGPSLGRQRWPEVGPDQLLLVPLGSTEQHGPHLPLDTDTRIAAAWAEALAPHLDRAVVAPPLPYGSAGEHQDFPGTLSIGHHALEAVLTELIRSARHTFRAVVLVCGHGGNAGPVGRVVDAMTAEGHHVVALFPSWSQAQMGTPIDSHAGRVETSLLLHLAPDAVALDRAEAGVTAPVDELIESLVSKGVRAVSANGVIGDPAGATAAEGQRLLADLVARSAARLGGTGTIPAASFGREGPPGRNRRTTTERRGGRP